MGGDPSAIANLVSSGYGLIAHCIECGRYSDLDVLGLSLRFGEEFGVPKLEGRLACTACGGKQCEVQVYSNRQRWPPTNA